MPGGVRRCQDPRAIKSVLEYGVRAPVFYGNLREQMGENSFPREPTGNLCCPYRDLRTYPETFGNLRENVIQESCTPVPCYKTASRPEAWRATRRLAWRASAYVHYCLLVSISSISLSLSLSLSLLSLWLFSIVCIHVCIVTRTISALGTGAQAARVHDRVEQLMVANSAFEGVSCACHVPSSNSNSVVVFPVSVPAFLPFSRGGAAVELVSHNQTYASSNHACSHRADIKTIFVRHVLTESRAASPGGGWPGIRCFSRDRFTALSLDCPLSSIQCKCSWCWSKSQGFQNSNSS